MRRIRVDQLTIDANYPLASLESSVVRNSRLVDGTNEMTTTTLGVQIETELIGWISLDLKTHCVIKAFIGSAQII